MSSATTRSDSLPTPPRRNNRGLAEYNKADAERAIADFNAAIAIDPRWRSPTATGEWPAPREASSIGRSPTAEAIRLNPTLALAYNTARLAHLQQGSLKEATADLDEAIRLDPAVAKAHNNRGMAYAEMGDDDRAIADYDAAVRLDARNAPVYGNRGQAYLRKGDIDRAIADCTEAIRLDPRRATAYNDGVSPAIGRAVSRRRSPT